MSSVMWFLKQIFGIIFYLLLFCWLFFKFRNFILDKKLKNKDLYIYTKNVSKKTKVSKRLFIVLLVLSIILVIYLFIGLVSGGLAFLMVTITFGGVAYAGSGVDSTFFYNLLDFVTKYFSLLKYIAYYSYLIALVWLIRAVYINNLIYKELSNKIIIEKIK